MFTYIATFIFAFLSFIWEKNTNTNLILKITFFAMFAFGFLNSLQLLGYVVKV